MVPKVAVIIATYNGDEYIKNCLASVFRNKYEGQFDVLVVDNGSHDETLPIIKKQFPQAELIKLKSNSGFVGGNDIGIKRALEKGCEYIVLLNQDTEVEYDWLQKLTDAASNQDTGIIQAMLLLGNERALTNNIGNAMHYLGFGFVKHYRQRVDSWYHRAPFEIGYASGAAMLIKREVIKKIGYLDEKFFMYHEDLDFCWRARLAGYKIKITPQAVVYHYYQFNRNKKMFYWTERNRWAVLLQNYSWATLLKLLPMFLFIELAMLAYSALGGWLHLKLKSYAWVWARWGKIMDKRRLVQSVRVVKDEEILRHMESKLEFSEVSNPILKYLVSPVAEWYYKFIL